MTQPNDTAFYFTIKADKNYKAYIDVVYMQASNDYYFESAYIDGSQWIFISGPDIPDLPTLIDTEAECDKVIDSAFEDINKKIKSIFKLDATAGNGDATPTSGIELIKWKLKNKTSFENNQLKRTG